MAKVISLKLVAEQRDVDIELAWERFRAAMLKSKETLNLQDGIAAGKAYRHFLDVCARAGL